MAVREAEATREIAVRRIAPALGAEVSGLDLARPLDADVVALLRDAFQQHHLLLFRGQELTAEQQIAFSENFGPLETFPEKDKTKGESLIYHVANTTPEGQKLTTKDAPVIFQKVNARWHTDSSYRFTPSLASLMYALEVLPDDAEGGETAFSNMFLAYDALSPAMKRRLEPLHMVHYYEFGRRLFPELPPVTAEEREFVPPVSHPVTRVHLDRGGRRSLYITTNAGNEIGGRSLEQGQALHRELAEHVGRDAFTYVHRMAAGDLVMWDNRCLLHRAMPYDMDRYRRVYRRTTVAGDGPIVGPFSQPPA
jgi:alpha-ketoglutarate-dependent 2,4-dichlorophenoxyacetate dioxygenase